MYQCRSAAPHPLVQANPGVGQRLLRGGIWWSGIEHAGSFRTSLGLKGRPAPERMYGPHGITVSLSTSSAAGAAQGQGQKAFFSGGPPRATDCGSSMHRRLAPRESVPEMHLAAFQYCTLYSQQPFVIDQDTGFV